MVQVDLPAAVAIGQLFAVLSRQYLKKEKKLFANRLTGVVSLFMGCSFVPVGMFFLVCWPSWEVMYRTGWVENPFNRPMAAAFYVAFGVIVILLGLAGFMFAHRWYQKGKDRLVLITTGIWFFLTALPFLMRWGVWMNIGTYQSVVVEKAGYSFFNPPFFYGWAGIFLYFAAGLIATIVYLVKVGNKLEP